MTRVILDTNVVVSALLQPLGPSAQIMMFVLGGTLQICVSGEVYAEYEEIVRRPRFGFDEEVIIGTLNAIRDRGFWVRPTERVEVCSDPDDNVFLECAQTAKAAYVVTGNTRHFPETWGDTLIVNPRRLLDLLAT